MGVHVSDVRQQTKQERAENVFSREEKVVGGGGEDKVRSCGILGSLEW